ncbi:MAG: hypothetical protein ABL974_19555 [Prosthecobacter sp.]
MIRFLVAVFFSAALHAAEPVLTLREKPVRVATASSAEIFPESWRGGKVAAGAEALPEGRREEALRVIDVALAKYPTEVLKEHLHTLYLLGELRYRGVVTSGTNSRTGVYVKIGPVEKGFTARHNEGVFHAEFSSILIRNRSQFMDHEAWKAANPTGFSYLGDGVDAVKQGKARTKADSTLNAQGFLSQYSQSTLENDFNGYAARLWTGDAALWQLAKEHPPIQRKLKLVLRFYQQLHAQMDETFFRGLQLKPD